MGETDSRVDPARKPVAPKMQHLPPQVRAFLAAGHGRYLRRQWQTWLGASLGTACTFIGGAGAVVFLPPAVAFVGVLFAAIAGGGIYLRLTRCVSIRYYRRRLGELGLCPGCGYDLRASTDRCPECGEPLPPTSPAL